MATKRTNTKQVAKKPVKKAAAPKRAPKQKQDAKPQGPRHPSGRVKDRHGGKVALA